MVARKAWVGGNWKCNGTKQSITDLAKALNEVKATADQVDALIFPVAIHVQHAQAALNEKFTVGVQNVSRTGNGAYTGELSVAMAQDFGVNWTLIGHSERRTLYGETDAITAEKVEAAQAAGMKVCFCIGETLEEREKGETDAVCARQMKAIIGKVKNWDDVVIAYEPVWAIGTGKVATPDQAQSAHAAVRKYIRESVSGDVADKIRIVYGGSVNEKNCEELARLADIDGFLVGGASLKPTFNIIIESAIKGQQ